MSRQLVLFDPYRRSRALALVACLLLSACGGKRVRTEDASTTDARVEDAARTHDAAADDARTADAGDEDAEVEDGDAEVEDAGAGPCASSDPDTLSAQIDPTWRVVESIVPPRRFADVVHVAGDADGIVHALESDPEIGRVWGKWPEIAPTNRTFDPAPPELPLTLLSDATDVTSDEGVLVVTFDAHVVVMAVGEPPIVLPAVSALSARKIGAFLFIAATAVGRGVEQHDEGAPFELPLWRLPIDDLRDAMPERVLDGPEELSGVHRIGLLGTRVLVYGNEPQQFGTPGSASLRITDRDALAAPSAALVLKGPNLIDEPVESLRMFDIDGGVVLWTANDVGVPRLRVLRMNGDALVQEQPLVPDECTAITHAFSAVGDLVVGLEHRSGARRLVHLRRR